DQSDDQIHFPCLCPSLPGSVALWLRGSALEAPGLSETRASRFIGHRISVTIHRVGVPGAAGLSGEREAAPQSQRLSRRQGELISQSRRVAAMALQYLPAADVVVLAAVV